MCVKRPESLTGCVQNLPAFPVGGKPEKYFHSATEALLSDKFLFRVSAFPGIHSGLDALSLCLCFGYGCSGLNMSLLNESKSKIQIRRSACAFSLLPNCFGIFWVSSNGVNWDRSACRLRSESKLEKLVLQQVNPKPGFVMKIFNSQSRFWPASPPPGDAHVDVLCRWGTGCPQPVSL